VRWGVEGVGLVKEFIFKSKYTGESQRGFSRGGYTAIFGVLLLVILESSETIMYQQGDATSCKGSK
jgi:hypothetical protein